MKIRGYASTEFGKAEEVAESGVIPVIRVIYALSIFDDELKTSGTFLYLDIH